MTEENLNGMRQMFENLDLDGSGTISLVELRDSLRQDGSLMNDEEFQALMNGVDGDHDGRIDFQVRTADFSFSGALNLKHSLLILELSGHKRAPTHPENICLVL